MKCSECDYDKIKQLEAEVERLKQFEPKICKICKSEPGYHRYDCPKLGDNPLI